MSRAVVAIVVAVAAHACAGWMLAGRSVAAQLLSPGPHAVVAAAMLTGFVLLRLGVVLVVPAITVAALIGSLERPSRPVVR